MNIVCSYCGKMLGTKPPMDNDMVTHGMCPACVEHFERQWSGLSLGEFLDDCEQPVIVFSGECRVIAVNQKMADLLGMSERELFGLLGGEAMECEYSRLPGGCGCTVHCETCAIRNSVNHTVETGDALYRVSALLKNGKGQVDLEISTKRVLGVVQVVIERVTRG